MPPETTPKATPSSLSALIDRLAELEAKATAGEWNYGMDASERHFYFHVSPTQRLEWHLETYGDIPVTVPDAALISELRNNCKTLLALSRWADTAKKALEKNAKITRPYAEPGIPDPTYAVLREVFIDADDALVSFPFPHV